MKDINFIFSSVTFLQQYIPLVIRAKELNMIYRFFIRANSKAYANPITHTKKWDFLFKSFNIPLFPVKDLNKYSGIIICTDGDIYGPGPKYWKTSAIQNLDRTRFYPIISLTENFNFLDSYPIYTQWIDYVIVQNQKHIDLYNFKQQQSLILGQPKFDVVYDNIYQKYKLNPNNKYALIFYPRFDRCETKFGKTFDYMLIYNWLKQLGFTILVKNREKLKLINNLYQGDKYFDDTYYYPNISMELLQITDIAIFFGSAVIEEIVINHVPFVEFILDKVDRFSFLRHSNYCYIVDDKFPTETDFKSNVNRILNYNDTYFTETINQYLFPTNCATSILQTIQKLNK
jgi:hypothetical protein